MVVDIVIDMVVESLKQKDNKMVIAVVVECIQAY